MDSTDEAEGAGKTSVPDADEMLAQLAGDEIDRLLAEAEAGTPPVIDSSRPNPAASERPAEAVPESETLSEDALRANLDDLFDEAAEKRPTKPPADAPALGEDSLSASLDGLFDEAADKTPAPAPVESASISVDALSANLDGLFDEAADSKPATPAPESKAVSDESLTANLDALFDEAATEKSKAATPAPDPENDSALMPAGEEPSSARASETSSVQPPAEPGTVSNAKSPVAPASAPTESVLKADDVEDAEADRPPPFYLKFLDVILAPLEAVPDPVRDALGKVGVVTLINAMAMIAYVMIFRHHHHG